MKGISVFFVIFLSSLPFLSTNETPESAETGLDSIPDDDADTEYLVMSDEDLDQEEETAGNEEENGAADVSEETCKKNKLTKAQGNQHNAITTLISLWQSSGKVDVKDGNKNIIAGKTSPSYAAAAKSAKPKFVEYVDSARIDNQGKIKIDGNIYYNLQLQLRSSSYACVKLREGVSKTAHQMRAAFTKSYKECVQIKIDA